MLAGIRYHNVIVHVCVGGGQDVNGGDWMLICVIKSSYSCNSSVHDIDNSERFSTGEQYVIRLSETCNGL